MSAATTPPLALRQLAGLVRDDFRRAFTPLVLFELAFKGVGVLVLLPGLTWALSALVQATGRTVVTNNDIAAFLLSFEGALYATLFAVATLGLWLLEHAGVMTVVVLKHYGFQSSIKRMLVIVGFAFGRILRLGLAILAAAVVGLAPFVGLALLTRSWLLSEYDVNYYLAARPPALYQAVALFAALALGAAALTGYLYVRWSFSLAIVVFEGRQPIPAMHESARRVRGAFWRIALVLGGWHLLGIALSAACLFLFRASCSYLLDGVGARPSVVIPTVAILFVLKLLLLALVSFLAVTVHCLLILRLYAERSIQFGAIEPGGWVPAVVAEAPPTPWLIQRWRYGAVGLACGVLLACGLVAGRLEAPRKLQVTGHRGHSTAAPENTLAAIRAAIAAGADYAEIDVQETKDGQIVLLHDDDLMRVCGRRGMVREFALAELKEMDAGSYFGEKFQGEKLPTLREVIHEARGKIKLNVELKFADEDKADKRDGPRRKKTGTVRKKETRAEKKQRTIVQKERLAHKVADMIREEKFEKECIVMSLDYEGLLIAKKQNPQLRTGLIVTATLSDLKYSQVDVWSVNASLVNDALVRKAHLLGKEVHAWMLDKKSQGEPEMRRLIQRGIDNIITDYPERAVKLRDEHQELSDVDHMLLAYRSLLEL